MGVQILSFNQYVWYGYEGRFYQAYVIWPHGFIWLAALCKCMM